MFSLTVECQGLMYTAHCHSERMHRRKEVCSWPCSPMGQCFSMLYRWPLPLVAFKNLSQISQLGPLHSPVAGTDWGKKWLVQDISSTWKSWGLNPFQVLNPLFFLWENSLIHHLLSWHCFEFLVITACLSIPQCSEDARQLGASSSDVPCSEAAALSSC